MQERHYPRSPKQNAQRRSSWLVSLAGAFGAAAFALLSTGCPEPADLENPEIYPKRGGGAGGSGTGGSASGGSATGGSATGGSAAGGGGNLAACETQCMATVLETCTLCHGSAMPLGMLDLASPGYSSRLKDQPATHSGITTANPQCPSGDKLIDSANKDASWLLKKVSGGQGTCGDAMPPGGLTGDSLKCAQDYVACVATGGM